MQANLDMREFCRMVMLSETHPWLAIFLETTSTLSHCFTVVFANPLPPPESGGGNFVPLLDKDGLARISHLQRAKKATNVV